MPKVARATLDYLDCEQVDLLRELVAGEPYLRIEQVQRVDTADPDLAHFRAVVIATAPNWIQYLVHAFARKIRRGRWPCPLTS